MILTVFQRFGTSFGVRHLQTLLLFFGLTIAYAMRVNLSVAVIAMSDRLGTNPDFEEYDWDEKTQSWLLSSFFIGYVFTQVPAGKLAQRFGGKLILAYSIGLCAILNILTPYAARFGDWKAVATLRVLEGLCQGFLFPSTHTLLSKWAPVEERGKLGTYCYTGSQVGTVIMTAISGILASSSLGWPSIFYISGSAGLVWSILWFFYGSNSPAECLTISEEERAYIEKSLQQKKEDGVKVDHSTPWGKIFTSMSFLSLMLVHCAHNWGFWTLLTKIPSYMKTVLEFDIKQNAMLSALPYLVMAVMGILFSHLSHALQQRDVLRLSVSRKLFNSIGLYVPMLALVALAFITKEHATAAVALLTVAVGINAATYLGFQVNHIDLAPNHAGVLMGITNCAANIMSVIAPLAVGYIVNESGNVGQWRIVFFIAAGIYFLGNTLFVVFGKTDVQPWNESQRSSRKEQEAAQQQQKTADFVSINLDRSQGNPQTLSVEER